MSAFDATVALLKELSDDELTTIHDLAFRYFKKKDSSTLFKAMTENEILECLEKARAESDAGNVMDADTASGMLRQKYAL